MQKKKIDFKLYGSAVYSGRERGEAVRTRLGLDTEDENGDIRYLVVAPPETIAISSSFVLGLFDKSIQRCGSEEQFKARFDFSNFPPRLMASIDEGIRRALIDGSAPYV